MMILNGKKSKEHCEKYLSFLQSRIQSESGQDAKETEMLIVYYEEMLNGITCLG